MACIRAHRTHGAQTSAQTAHAASAESARPRADRAAPPSAHPPSTHRADAPPLRARANHAAPAEASPQTASQAPQEASAHAAHAKDRASESHARPGCTRPAFVLALGDFTRAAQYSSRFTDELCPPLASRRRRPPSFAHNPEKPLVAYFRYRNLFSARARLRQQQKAFDDVWPWTCR